MLVRLFSVGLCASLAVGCDRPASSPKVTAPPAAAQYEARGTIRKINLAAHSAVIAHEAIPGYMDAMAMELDAADARELERFQPGDVVTFRLSVNDARSWIDRLHKVGTAPVPPPDIAEPARPANAPAADCAL